MAKRAQFQIEGMRAFRRTCREAGVDLADLKAALGKAAALVERTAVFLAPRRDGDLVASIRSRSARTTGTVLAGRKSTPYAGPIHWGWPARGIKANPFITKAAAETESDWLPFITEHVETTLDQIKGK